ncbi:hypothetical protein E2C01_057818 [Portunus trituberculatus]|uniref:Uncharacterized protein n=1 Tax=Portunus trituberculatus TaxID=210409 RepID=A0A5B7H1I4_PORTR|nr:hypothetical protein [Portunus trituberculatus]
MLGNIAGRFGGKLSEEDELLLTLLLFSTGGIFKRNSDEKPKKKYLVVPASDLAQALGTALHLTEYAVVSTGGQRIEEKLAPGQKKCSPDSLVHQIPCSTVQIYKVFHPVGLFWSRPLIYVTMAATHSTTIEHYKEKIKIGLKMARSHYGFGAQLLGHV